MATKEESTESAVVDLARARVRLRARGVKPQTPSHAQELAAINLLLDKGQSVEARERLGALISEAHDEPITLAEARLALSVALDMHGDFRASSEVLAMYDSEESRTHLTSELAIKIRVQASLAYSNCGDHPKAIAMLQAALRDASDNASAALVHLGLARAYRKISEYSIARDYSQQALELYRQSGDWRGLAEAHFGMALSDQSEGQDEAALEKLGQALNLIGQHPATFFLGKIYANMAGVCFQLRRPQEGIGYLERAIDYYEGSDHRMAAAIGYNNLGINLTLIGFWDRAQECFQRSVDLITEIDDQDQRLSMALDSLGELCLLRGDLDEAKSFLTRAVSLASMHKNKWYECQTLRTMAKCHLAFGNYELALETANHAIELAETIGDAHAIWESELLRAEAQVENGETENCETTLRRLSEKRSDSPAAAVLTGEGQRIHGKLARAHSDMTVAAQHFGRSLSIFELLGDKYRTGRAHFDLGQAYASTQPALAGDHLTIALNTFRDLGAKLDVERAEQALREYEQTPHERKRRQEAALQLVLMRLAEAVASRALLLRELAAVIRQETGADRVVVIEPDEEQKYRAVVSHGYNAEQLNSLVDQFAAATDAPSLKRFGNKHDAAVIGLKSANSLPATLIISPRERAELAGGLSLDPLVRIVELGLDVCALRARASATQHAEQQEGDVGTNLMPGFIHSSPAMTRLVEEVNKIRSSDVTVLVTGESGTGKELVARAIHALSSRRDKIFVPFNCTAVPKELSESYLFGHRRGAFTGAVSDSVGVIRSAAGGTLFIDEIGDLPLDVQPKLLRFLQEGEIQPLGEQQPVHIDVRIIAATNTDLEEMVAQGKFREDLYYRLNVIRLRVPPLRERRSEIPSIVSYYVNHYSAKFGRHDIQITPQAVDLLMVADWPGNVRQLCNEVQRIVARAENGTVLGPEHLSPELRQMGVPTAPAGSVSAFVSGRTEVISIENVTLADALEKVERRMITESLRKHRGNISRAARELGLTRRGLYLKIDRYQIGEDWRAETG